MHFGANKKPVEVIKEGAAFGETHMRDIYSTVKLGFHDGIVWLTCSKIRGIENWNTL